jgi:5-methylcytosine-specific restriction endonuclease McrA
MRSATSTRCARRILRVRTAQHASSSHARRPTLAAECLRIPRHGRHGAEYLRKYNKAARQRRRAQLVEMLGGKCVRCGSTENLQFDHIDPDTKRFAVGESMSRAWAELVEEALKCQLLCRDPCHREKGVEDRPEIPCGSYFKYWYWGCRCSACRAANAAKSARLRAQRLGLGEPSRAQGQSSGTLSLDRSGVAQSAEQPAVNRLVGSSSLPPRAKAWGKRGPEDRRSRPPGPQPGDMCKRSKIDQEPAG